MAEDETISTTPSAPPQSASQLPPSSEDAETRATRRELRQHTISDDANNTLRPETPADDAAEDYLREQVTSPKKKRAHDQLDSEDKNKTEEGEHKEDDAEGSVSSDSSGKDRASRLEPEKKRHRDEEPASNTNGTKPSSDGLKPDTQTSSGAFAASGFGKVTSGTSPFASLVGKASSGSAFGSTTGPKLSSFASKPASTALPAASTTPSTMSFGATDGVSPFAGLPTTSTTRTNGFGSVSGGASSASAFGSAFGGAKPLTSFGGSFGSVKPLVSEKPAKPFGAPDSDVESGEGEEEIDEEDKSDNGVRSPSPEKESDDKKKTKLQKVEVDDGEAAETTISSVRAKMFYMDKEHGWRERGAGMLKINVPSGCVDFDETGLPIPDTFDASVLDDEEQDDQDAATEGSKVVRLLMRQDQTHRILLNTAVVPTMHFQEKANLKSVGVLFTAFEGAEGKAVSVTMRMSAANAKTFLRDIEMVQRELRGG